MINFAAPTPLKKVTQTLNQIFKIQRQIKYSQNEQFIQSKQKFKFTISNLYLLFLPDEVLILGLMYIDKLTLKQNIMITKKNASTLLVLCVMMADKYLSDDPRPIRLYSQTGGIQITTLLELEIIFLEQFEFSLNISQREYDEYIIRNWN